jgi:hypothetical protein
MMDMTDWEAARYQDPTIFPVINSQSGTVFGICSGSSSDPENLQKRRTIVIYHSFIYCAEI